jgi:hypothetical protein
MDSRMMSGPHIRKARPEDFTKQSNGSGNLRTHVGAFVSRFAGWL